MGTDVDATADLPDRAGQQIGVFGLGVSHWALQGRDVPRLALHRVEAARQIPGETRTSNCGRTGSGISRSIAAMPSTIRRLARDVVGHLPVL